MGMFAAGFAAIKFLPNLEFTGAYPRLAASEGMNSPQLLLIALFSRAQDPGRPAPGVAFFHEYGAYLGTSFAALALFGIVLRFRHTLPWTILSLILLALAVGDFGPYAPWNLLHKLPFFVSTRMPSRWLIPFTLGAGVLAGFGTDAAISAAAKPWGTIVAALLIGLALFDSWSVNAFNLHNVPVAQEIPPARSENFRQLLDGRYSTQMFLAAKANLGALSCYDTIGWRGRSAYLRGYDQPGYRGEQYLLGAGTVTLVRWTPNALSYDLDLPAPTTLVVNQNYDPGWRVAQGRGAVISRNDLIGVKVSAGKQRIVLIYRSRPFLIGLWVTLGTFVTMLALWQYERRIETGPCVPIFSGEAHNQGRLKA
jgi:hypothetical protein